MTRCRLYILIAFTLASAHGCNRDSHETPVDTVKRLNGSLDSFDTDSGQSLKTVNLNSQAVTDEDLANIVKIPNLGALTLNSTGVTDAGLAHLNAAPELRLLSLNGTAITDSGLKYVAAHGLLTNLALNDTPITRKTSS